MNVNAKIVMQEMLQSCRNIMAATSGVSMPEAFDRDPFLLENIYMNFVILVESYIRIGDEKSDFPTIDWEEIGAYTRVINRPVNTINKNIIIAILKNKVPSLTAKLETLYNNGRF